MATCDNDKESGNLSIYLFIFSLSFWIKQKKNHDFFSNILKKITKTNIKINAIDLGNLYDSFQVQHVEIITQSILKQTKLEKEKTIIFHVLIKTKLDQSS